jgi:hypothetical protein
MKLSDLQSAISYGSGITNGWGAVCAMNLSTANAIFQQQYVLDAKDGAKRRLEILATTAGGATVAMDAQLGPPLITFAASDSVTLSMQVVAGRVMVIEDAPRYTITLSDATCSITGTVPLSAVQGTIAGNGSVVADFKGGMFELGPKWILPSDVMDALNANIQASFQQSGLRYALGSLDGTHAQKPLVPANFSFATQSSDEGSDAAILLLVNTGQGNGTAGPLPVYPIPDGSTASLLIDTSAFIGVALQATLPSNFVSVQTGNEGELSWQGSIDVGNVANSDNTIWCSDFKFPQVTVTVAGANLMLAARQQFPSLFDYTTNHLGAAVTLPAYAAFSASLNDTIAPALDTAGSVSLSATGSPLQIQHSEWVDEGGLPIKDEILGDGDLKVLNVVSAMVQKAFSALLGKIDLPAVKVFALESLLFPQQSALTVDNAYLGEDLLLTGSIAPQLSITPATTVVPPGGTAQFSASQNGAAADVTWSAHSGTVVAGKYTAPTTDDDGNPITRAQLDVVTAMLNSNNDVAGGATVVIQPHDNAVFLGPAIAIVAPGAVLPITAMNPDGTPIAVMFTLSPNAGSVSTVQSGSYEYAAPPTPTKVSINGVTPDATRGTIEVTVASAPTLTVTCSVSGKLQSDVPFGFTVSGGSSSAAYLWWVSGDGTLDSVTGTHVEYTTPGPPVGVRVPFSATVTIHVCQPANGAYGSLELQIFNASAT